jgi:hypothetical protein
MKKVDKNSSNLLQIFGNLPSLMKMKNMLKRRKVGDTYLTHILMKATVLDENPFIFSDHVERKVPKYENHKLRERKVKTLTRN